MGDGGKNPDLNIEVGYNLAKQEVKFSLGIGNLFDKIGKKRFGFSETRWWTRRQGKLAAKQGSPATHMELPDGREQRIRTQRDINLRSLTDLVQDQAGKAREWIRDHTPQALSKDRLEREIDATLSEVRAKKRDNLESAKHNLQDSTQRYQSFRNKHGLERHAQVPLYFLAPIVLLFCVFLFETIMNAIIFAAISPQGMLGGWLNAAVISGINVFLGLILGYVIIRYARYLKGNSRYALIAIGIVLTIAAFLFNLYVAHFREVAEAAILADQTGEAVLTRDRVPNLATAWPHFMSNPLNIASLSGWFLLILGCGIYGFAAYEGYGKFSDPYPGYGKVGKAYLLAQISEREFRQQMRESSVACLHSIGRVLNSSQVLHNHFKAEVNKAIDFASSLNLKAKEAENRVNDHAWALINDYRTANRNMRRKLIRKAERQPDKDLSNPGPPPAYFDEDPRLEWTRKSLVPNISELSSISEETKKTIEANLKLIDDMSKHIAMLIKRIADDTHAADEALKVDSAAGSQTDKFSHPSRFKTV